MHLVTPFAILILTLGSTLSLALRVLIALMILPLRLEAQTSHLFPPGEVILIAFFYYPFISLRYPFILTIANIFPRVSVAAGLQVSQRQAFIFKLTSSSLQLKQQFFNVGI
jgi:hypothetical protein